MAAVLGVRFPPGRRRPGTPERR
uniref:Uncharacterized protein n=1 Tax=Anguilla anguilla TaxID=7936 RepID=A0A0E9UM39_ANGAN